MKKVLLIALAIVAMSSPALARGSHHSGGGSRSHAGKHLVFAREVHQMRHGRMVTIRPKHAKALRFYAKNKGHH